MPMDERFMEEALALASAGLGRVWPNPSVGCVIVRGADVVGRGATQPGGRPHAEVVALQDAGTKAEGATAFVSLEPCAHFGKTPPCADALIRARIRRCVVALIDPDPRVDGKGLERMKDAGITVELGLYADAARAINEGFFLRVRSGRPMVTVVDPKDLTTELERHDAVLESSPEGSGVWAEVRGAGVAPVRWWIGGELPLGGHAWRRFECPSLEPAAVLGQLGAQGLTRVLIGRDDALAVAARKHGLIDRDGARGLLETENP